MITSHISYLHLSPCFRVSFWESKLRWKDRKYLEQRYNLPTKKECLWAVISSLCQKFQHKKVSTHLLSSNLFISWSGQKHCFPEGIRTPVKDYFLPLLDHRKQEQSLTLNRLYHPLFHRASGCLFIPFIGTYAPFPQH